MSLPSGEIFVPRFRGECLLSRGTEVRDLLRLREETVLYVQPCTSERGKLMADIELRSGDTECIDSKTLCALLEIHRRRFSELKCSRNLGVAKLMWKGREISIFKNGKIKIQRALNREEIIRVANSVARLIWGAELCEVCGQPALNCASGACGKCTQEERVSIELDELPNAELLQQSQINLQRARKAAPEESERLLNMARYQALFFAIEAPRKEDAVPGLVLLAEALQSGVQPKR